MLHLQKVCPGPHVTLAAMTAVLSGGHAGAQTEQKVTSAVGLQEILVTARRVQENLQEVPVSVALFDSATIEERTVTDLIDLTRIAPGMRFQGQGNIASTDITVRGVNRVPVGSGGATTVVYFMEVPIANTTYLPTYDLDNLQLLRGPQGTLFGTSTIGGAILINPQLPTYEHDGYVKVTGGKHDYRQLEGAGNVPLIDDVLTVRLAAQIRRRDPYVENVGPGPDFNDIDTDSYRVAVLFEPVEAVRNTLVFDYIEGDETGWATIPFRKLGTNPNPLVNAAVDAALALGHYKTNTELTAPFFERKTWGLFNTTKWQINDSVELNNIISYRDSKDAFVIDTDGTAAPIFPNGRLTHEEDVTEELQLRGAAFADRLAWTIGGFYQKTTPLEAGGLNAAGVQVSNLTSEDEGYAVFGNVGFRVSDAVTLNAGYRYSWTEQSNCIGPVAAGRDRDSCEEFAATSTDTDGFGFVETKASAPTWTVGLDWRATENLFFYATHRHGFRFGGASSGIYEHPCLRGGAVPPCRVPFGGTGRAIDISAFQDLKNETMDDLEIGMRSDWVVGGRYQRLNLTAFHYVYDDLVGQVTLIGQLDPTIPGAPFASTIAFNSGTVKADGVELDLILNPFEGLTLAFNTAYTDQRQTKEGTGPAGFPVSSANLAAPRWAHSVSAQYVLPLRPFGSQVSINADYFKTESFEVQTTPMDGYNLTNVRVDMANIANSGVSAGVWVRNLFDEDYLQSATFVGTVGLPAQTGNFGDPRLWGVDVTYRW